MTFKRADAHPDSPDSQWIWQWRNDPVTREMSLTTDVIPWENHKTWYAQAARDRNKVLLIASERDEPVGMVRFDLQAAAAAEISINLNPALRGSGRGKRLLASACAWGFRSLALARIFARIKPQNLRSIRVFEGIGFVFIEEQAGYRAYSLLPDGLVTVPRHSLDAP